MIPDVCAATPFPPLFVPGDRLDRLDKARRAGASAVIVDWEDAVAAPARDDARAGLAATLARSEGGAPVLVRINAVGTADHARDVKALRSVSDVSGVLPAKAEDPGRLSALADTVGQPVLALIETARGLANARPLAAVSARLAFGSLDYAAALGARHMRESLSLARQELVLASSLAGRGGPIDGVTAALDEPDAVTDDARYAADLGFGGKLLIHPRQFGPAREGFAPTDKEVDEARRIPDAARWVQGGGAVKYQGAMIDPPVLARGERAVAMGSPTGTEDA